MSGPEGTSAWDSLIDDLDKARAALQRIVDDYYASPEGVIAAEAICSIWHEGVTKNGEEIVFEP